MPKKPVANEWDIRDCDERPCALLTRCLCGKQATIWV